MKSLAAAGTVTRRRLAPLSVMLPEAAGAADDLDDWLDREDIPDGVPYLVSPDVGYDIDPNRYFLRPALAGASRDTQLVASSERPGTGLQNAAVLSSLADRFSAR